MSRYYNFDAFLQVRFEEKIISSLIHKGNDLGFIYFIRTNSTSPLKEISLQEAINILLTTRKDHGDNFFSSESLMIKYQDTFFALWMYEKNYALNIHILLIGNIWKKRYKNDDYVDIGRYTKILIDLCEDFPFVKICTETD